MHRIEAKWLDIGCRGHMASLPSARTLPRWLGVKLPRPRLEPSHLLPSSALVQKTWDVIRYYAAMLTNLGVKRVTLHLYSIIWLHFGVLSYTQEQRFENKDFLKLKHLWVQHTLDWNSKRYEN
jgi:hypothetical protein